MASGVTYHYKINPETGLEILTVNNVTQLPPSWGLSNEDFSSAEGPPIEPTIWQLYMRSMRHYDSDLIKDANNTVDVLLVFAGLFSAVLSALIQITYPKLQPDQGDILLAILQETRQPGSTTHQKFEVPLYATRVNFLLFTGLFISIFVALLGILVKQWARSYQRNLESVSSTQLRARVRHYRYVGAKYWGLSGFVALLSISMHIALFISAIGILHFLYATAPETGAGAATALAIGTTIFIVTSLIPVFRPEAPYRSPLSRVLTWIVDKIHQPAQIKKDEESKGGGLEDDFKQSSGEATKEIRIVRSQLQLDLDIITHLMKRADKSTERSILDKCFERLPNLTLLAREEPQSILEQEIIGEVYVFLAQGCLLEGKAGAKAVNPDRLKRSRILCEFLRWFLSLKRTSELRIALKTRFLHHGFNPRELPTALANDEDATNRAIGYSALGCIEHLLDQESDDPDCELCKDRLGRIQTQGQPLDREVMMQNITTFIIGFSNCLLAWDLNGHKNQMDTVDRDERCRLALEKLKSVLEPSDPPEEEAIAYVPLDKEKASWKLVLEEARGATDDLKRTWFDPVIAFIDTVQSNPPATPFDAQPGPKHTTAKATSGGSRNPRVSTVVPGGNVATTSGYVQPLRRNQL